MGSRDEIQVRNSERITFTTCPQKWWWAYVELLRSADTTPALRFGTLVHSAMEAFYLPGIKRGPRPRITFEKLFEESQKTMHTQGIYDSDGEWHELGELGVVLLDAYYEKYGKDDRWYVIATEMPFRVRTEDRQTGLVFTMVGVVDGLWADRETGNKVRLMKKYVADHKTTKDDPTKKTDALTLDEQTGTYWSYGVDYLYAQGILNRKRDENLAGMIFNFLRKGKPDLRPQNSEGHYLNRPTKDALWERVQTLELHTAQGLRKSDVTVDYLIELIGPSALKLGEVSAKQPAPLFYRERVLRGQAEGESVRMRTEAQAYNMHLIRRGKLRLTKTPGTLHSPHCNWCEFKAMCELHESGADWERFRDAAYTVWDPYEQHEIKNAEQV
jgi:hypothetical protein